MQVKVLSRKLRELTDLVWVKSLTRQGQKLDLHTISSHFTQFAGKYLRTIKLTELPRGIQGDSPSLPTLRARDDGTFDDKGMASVELQGERWIRFAAAE